MQVFVHGQGVPEELQLEYEDECVHFIALNDDQQAVGTGRLRDAEGLYVKFERVRSRFLSVEAFHSLSGACSMNLFF